MEHDNNLLEAERNFMLPREEAYKKRFIQMLKNKDGKWGPYKHAQYAKRLAKYNLYIVPLTDDPYYTASLNFEDCSIRVGEGLLRDEKYFYQLNTVIRHELAHKLLMHQFRLLKKLGKEMYDRLAKSPAFHGLFNTLADYEISNRKYTEEDKEIMRKLYVTDKYVQCLVTEDSRAEWSSKSITLEQMFDFATKELEQLKKALANELKQDEMEKINPNDHTTATEMQLLVYKEKTKPSFIWLPLDRFFVKDRVARNMSGTFKELIVTTYNNYKDEDESTIKKLIDEVAATDLMEPALINDKKYWWPEEKFLIVSTLKTIIGNSIVKPKIKVKKTTHSKKYVKKFNKYIKKCGTKSRATDDDITEILAGIGGDEE